MLAATILLGSLLCGCAGEAGEATNAGDTLLAAPTITTTPAQNGAVVAILASATTGATIHYTVDGSAPTEASQIYEAPFLVASNLTVKAIATTGSTVSSMTSESFAPNIPSGMLVWSDEFNNTTGVKSQPNPQIWTYDNSKFAGGELEDNCAWGSSLGPCSVASPSEYVGTDGYLHIVAQQPSAGIYTSARMKTAGLFSFQYGRYEARIKVPEAQGFWPGVWLLGNNSTTVNWPACGEMDVLERVDGPTTPDTILGSVHGTGFTVGGQLGTIYNFPGGKTAAGWHTYGMIWSKGSVAYYVDDPTHPYATYTPANLRGITGAVWPFDDGQSSYLLLDLAIGGSWPGSPNATTPFPSEMLVDYVRVYTN
jgi:beta-glucanase (GH16 family)